MVSPTLTDVEIYGELLKGCLDEKTVYFNVLLSLTIEFSEMELTSLMFSDILMTVALSPKFGLMFLL